MPVFFAYLPQTHAKHIANLQIWQTNVYYVNIASPITQKARHQMKLLIALGGNALLQRGEPMTVAAQWRAVSVAAGALAVAARSHQLIVTHGNGPQVGLLAMQAQAFEAAEPYTLDVMCAATGGMIGYMLEQEMGNILGYDVPVTTILTRIVVNANDPEFADPSKFIGPVLDKESAEKLAAAHGWQFKRDGAAWRRVVPSPFPQRILWHRPIRWLLEQNAVVICNGGGGIPVVAQPDGSMKGVEAVIDKDRASGLLATRIPADLLVLATDVDGVYAGFGTAQQRRLSTLYSAEIDETGFAAGSMGPKITAARAFADATGKPAVIGALDRIPEILAGTSGTRILPGKRP